ncbi:hypothetical protein C2E23DRAFT_824546 [Lenzites betulinus]|nr:hypothetical protein C2E23DRAFT_824546 [Lenzites betulinus]
MLNIERGTITLGGRRPRGALCRPPQLARTQARPLHVLYVQFTSSASPIHPSRLVLPEPGRFYDIVHLASLAHHTMLDSSSIAITWGSRVRPGAAFFARAPGGPVCWPLGMHHNHPPNTPCMPRRRLSWSARATGGSEPLSVLLGTPQHRRAPAALSALDISTASPYRRCSAQARYVSEPGRCAQPPTNFKFRYDIPPVTCFRDAKPPGCPPPVSRRNAAAAVADNNVTIFEAAFDTQLSQRAAQFRLSTAAWLDMLIRRNIRRGCLRPCHGTAHPPYHGNTPPSGADGMA